MKILRILLVFTVLLSLNFKQSQAQDKKPFTGTITISLSYEGDVDAATLAQQLKEMELKINATYTKMEINQGGVYTSVIKNREKKEITTLMDIPMLGKKFCLKQNAEAVAKTLSELPKGEIKYFDETKNIAGYNCKKGELYYKDEDGKDVTSVFYYTEDLYMPNSNFDTPYMDVKGTLMEWESSAQNMKIKQSISKVKKSKMSDKEFLIPTGYQEMTEDELRELFSQ
ncbi:MAG: hypothetical protein KA792_02085 [Bacteroidales bacterium]|nr:hypothetical protein [Bacteroidales bacterium]